MRHLGQPSPHRRGAAAVEMAIVLPIFFMVVMGIVEFGRAMMVGQLVTNAARFGARTSAVDGATNVSVTTAVQNFVSTSAGVAPTDVTVTIVVTPGVGNPNPANNLSIAQAKDICNVSVKVPYNKVAYVAGRYLAGKDIKAQCVMRHE